ncbi:Pvc16 family protein [Streptomyces sp. NPDC004111]|uniref:Pvc16 family protein n=1 Tax=Streptomyces sp. NPDC004111 TaxID=3364690 RepID=UPI0036B5DB4F
MTAGTVGAGVDLALGALFRERMTTLGAGTPGGVAAAQIGFAPPDADWANDVGHLAPARALNVYLAELRENRELRSNERLRSALPGPAGRQQAPMRVDCHYLISAWSPSADRATRTLDEHGVLGEVLAVLVQAQVLTAGGEELPIAVLPPGGFGPLRDFWHAMGDEARWRPVVHLVVTAPVPRAVEYLAPEVTTRFAEYRVKDPDRPHGTPGAAGTRLQIAGVVRDGGVPVAGAWVQLETAGGDPVRAVRSNGRGEFTFPDVAPGNHRLLLRVPGRNGPPATAITVPSPTGRYDLALS